MENSQKQASGDRGLFPRKSTLKERLTLPGFKSPAMKFVLLMGLVSLFSDMTYEAARSINGPYLALLGASGMIVGLTAGLGELFGYGLRVVSGLLSDKTQRYWAITLFGYAVNLLAVPLLALTHHWELAASLMVTERIGKAIRTPARDTMLSYAGSSVGRGWAFAVHEAFDQTGAMVGPLIVMTVLALSGSYQNAFAVLGIPAVLALAVLLVARITYPQPQDLEKGSDFQQQGKMPRVFWQYVGATALVAAGFADYPLIAFHIKSHSILDDKWIPLIYSCTMGIDALAALTFGRWYDKKGLRSLMAAIVLSAPFALFAFSFTPYVILGGMVLWGIGMGAQESIIRAAVADMVPAHRRGTGYGLFNAGYGVAWFVGSTLMGLFYDFSIPAVIIFSIVCQVAALPILFYIQKQKDTVDSVSK